MSEIEQLSNVQQNRIKISEKKVEKRQLAVENEIYHIKKAIDSLEGTCKHLLLFETKKADRMLVEELVAGMNKLAPLDMVEKLQYDS